MAPRFFKFMLFLGWTTVSLYAQDCHQPFGKWENENGSVLEITDRTQNHRISGIYGSHEGTEGQAFKLTGWWPEKDTTSISFTVYWSAYGTLTSWTGICKGDTLEVLWHHVDPNATYEFQQWSTQRSVFRPLEQKATEE